MLIIHSPRCLEYAAPGHPERPDRVRSAATALAQGSHTWLTPEPCSDEDILRVHTAAHLESVKRGDFADADTPNFPNIYELARLAAGAAILAAESATATAPAFSLMRPPGHHAERDRVMGFCYFNNIAIAAAKVLENVGAPFRARSASDGPVANSVAPGRALLQHAKPAKVAILDFDCHHGNGTEDIFRGDDRVLFVSLHQSPCYPGTGLDSQQNIVNYPLPPGTGEKQFLATLDEALKKIEAFEPTLLAVSAGFDAYKRDPITQMGLEVETFGAIGARLKTFCAGTLPSFAVLEGGYARDLADCIVAFVNGWEGL